MTKKKPEAKHEHDEEAEEIGRAVIGAVRFVRYFTRHLDFKTVILISALIGSNGAQVWDRATDEAARLSHYLSPDGSEQCITADAYNSVIAALTSGHGLTRDMLDECRALLDACDSTQGCDQ